jgi:hypothetical protein
MKVLTMPQRSPEWHAARRGLPTASRFDLILTAAKGEPSKSQEKLIAELIAESIEPPEQGFIRTERMTPEMEQGLRLEGEARSSFELEFANAPVSEVGFVLADCELYGGSPDALVGEDSGVEIKCPNLSTHIGYVRAGVLPLDYKCQVHGSMIITGRPTWHFFSYARHVKPFHILVRRDDFTAKLEAELLAFVARYNQARALFDLPPIGPMAETAAAQ